MKESDFYLKELRVLVPYLDFKLLSKLKAQESVCNADLCLAGDILLTSWRSYC